MSSPFPSKVTWKSSHFVFFSFIHLPCSSRSTWRQSPNAKFSEGTTKVETVFILPKSSFSWSGVLQFTLKSLRSLFDISFRGLGHMRMRISLSSISLSLLSSLDFMVSFSQSWLSRTSSVGGGKYRPLPGASGHALQPERSSFFRRVEFSLSLMTLRPSVGMDVRKIEHIKKRNIGAAITTVESLWEIWALWLWRRNLRTW